MCDFIIIVTGCFDVSPMIFLIFLAWNNLIFSHFWRIDRFKSWSIIISYICSITKVMSLFLNFLIVTETLNIRSHLFRAPKNPYGRWHLVFLSSSTHVVFIDCSLVQHGHLKFLLLLQEFKIIFEVIWSLFSFSRVMVIIICMLPIWWLLAQDFFTILVILSESICLSWIPHMLRRPWVFKLRQILSLLSNFIVNIPNSWFRNIIDSLTHIVLSIWYFSITGVCIYQLLIFLRPLVLFIICTVILSHGISVSRRHHLFVHIDYGISILKL
jgi:hypothetical protein